MGQLVERFTGDVIPAADHNDVKSIIEDALYPINTSALSIDGTEIITSDRVIRLDNDSWVQSRDSANTQYMNMLKLNTSDMVEFGRDVVLGAIFFEDDAGDVKFTDMEVTSTPSAGTQQSYSFDIDNQKILQIYAEANSFGGIKNNQVRSFAPLTFIGSENNVDAPGNDQGKLFIRTSGSTPNREVVMVVKNQTDDEIIIWSKVV